jgi:hypothetical protein
MNREALIFFLFARIVFIDSPLIATSPAILMMDIPLGKFV